MKNQIKVCYVAARSILQRCTMYQRRNFCILSIYLFQFTSLFACIDEFLFQPSFVCDAIIENDDYAFELNACCA